MSENYEVLSVFSPVGSDYFKIVEGDRDLLFVVFSSVDIARGKFMFWKQLNRLSGTKIFINDDSNGWYLHGVPGLGGDVVDCADNLCSIIKKFQPKEVVFIGPSMGGYASMLYGAIIKPRLYGIKVRCLSFGGEFLLYERETRSKALTGRPFNSLYADIRPLLASSRLDVTHVYGDDDINDAYQAFLVEKIFDVKKYSIRNAPHAVSTFLGQNFDLNFIFRFYVEKNSFPDFGVSDSSKIKSFGSDLYFGHLSLLDGKKDDALALLGRAAKAAPFNALARHKYGLALLIHERYDEALSEQRAAVDINPNLAHAHYHLGIILNKKGFVDEAFLCFTKCLDVNAMHTQSILELAKIFYLRKNFESAKNFVDKVKVYDPKNKKAADFSILIDAANKS